MSPHSFAVPLSRRARQILNNKTDNHDIFQGPTATTRSTMNNHQPAHGPLPLHRTPCPIHPIYNLHHIQTVGMDCPYKHQQYHWPSVSGTANNALIGDSLIKYIKDLDDTEVHAYPGTKLEWITQKIQNGNIKLHGYKIIVFHLGCNNLRHQETNKIVELFEELLLLSKTRNDSAAIVLSLIIPWNNETPDQKHKRETLNTQLRKLVLKLGKGFYYFQSWKAMYDKITKELVQSFYTDDNVHLKRGGVRALRDSIDGNIKILKGKLKK